MFVSFSYVSRADEPRVQERGKGSLPSTLQEDMIVDAKGERHSFVVCPVVRDGHYCLHPGRIRDASIVHHDCPLLTQHTITSLMKARPAQQRAIPPTQKVDYHEQIRNLLVSFIAGTPISFRLVSSTQFKELLFHIIEIAQSHVSVPADRLLPSLSVHTIPFMLKARASELYTVLLSSFKDTYVTIHIDSAVIGHTSYLAVTIRQVQSKSPIYFIQLLNSPSGKHGYTLQICSIIEFLKRHNIFVVSICCDGASAQVSSITDVRKSLNTPNIPNFQRSPVLPLHIPCFNHRINLALQHATRSPVLARVVSELQNFASLASTKAYKTILGKTCPGFVSTRWFSLWNIASFIRLHRDKILQGNLLPLPILMDILKAEVLLTPFTELTLFFESDKVQLSSVYPAVLRALAEYAYIANTTSFNAGDWLHATMDCMVELYNYCFTGTIGPLICVAFWLQPYGRILYYQNRMRSGYRLDTPLFESFSHQFVDILSSHLLF